MTYTEVLELIRAGFNKSEIQAMIDAETADKSKEISASPANETPAPKQETQTKTDIPSEQSEVKETKTEPTETEKLVSALGMKFDALTQALQNKNVNSIEGTTNTTTTDDIIAHIINPHHGEE